MLDLTRLDALKAARREKAGEVARLQKAVSLTVAAQDDEKAALDAISELGAEEVAAIKEWASAGGSGDMPQPDHAGRERLAGELIKAQRANQNAIGARGDLEDALRFAGSELSHIGEQIEDLTIEQIFEEAIASRALAFEAAKSVGAKLARSFSMHQFLAERGALLINSGRPESETRGRQILAKLEQFRALPVPDCMPTNGEVSSEMPHWARRFAIITSDDVVQIEKGNAA